MIKRRYSKETQDELNSANLSKSATESSIKSEMTQTEEEKEDETPKKSKQRYYSISVLFVINLLNYMDRFTIAGVLPEIQDYFSIDDAYAGLLQTVFMVFFLFFSPLCGYLGDRHNRKYIMIAGISVWVLAVFGSTFVGRNHFVLFLLLRGVVGIGEASYAVISPSIIADLFTGLLRSRMLMMFYFAIPVGSGLGYIIGSTVAHSTGQWQWGVRVTAILGVICLLLISFFVREPERGEAERRKQGSPASPTECIKSSYIDDIKHLLGNKTYIFSTIGYTAIVFVVGTLSWWAPTAIQHATADTEHLNSTMHLDSQVKSKISLIFGVITCLAGIVGVAMGTILSNWLSNGSGLFRCLRCLRTSRSDPIICAVGAFIGVPTLFLAILYMAKIPVLSWVMMFICITALCFNWAINVDMLMSVIVPHRRNTANSWQILISHLFGDASGPYIIGLISDWIRGSDDSPGGHFHSLVGSFYLPNAILVVSVILFALTAVTLPNDQKTFQEEITSQIRISDISPPSDATTPSSGRNKVHSMSITSPSKTA